VNGEFVDVGVVGAGPSVDVTDVDEVGLVAAFDVAF
jgi:hypothetical protein